MSISIENMIVFWSDLIKMVAELKFFKCKQINCPRWLPRAVTKKSINMKMILSEEILKTL